MESAWRHPASGTPYTPSRSVGFWGRACLLCVMGGLVSGLLYAFCLMAGPVRWSWTISGRSTGGLPGLAAIVCALPAVGFGIVAIGIGRIGARWLARTLVIGIGLIVGATSFVALLGQAPLGSDALLATRPVAFRDVSLGLGAWEVVSEPSRLRERILGLRAVAAGDISLFAGVLLGALICAGLAADWSFRGARLLTGGLMLDDRSGTWFSPPRDVMLFEPLVGRDPTAGDLAHLRPARDEEGVIHDRPMLVLRYHESNEALDREIVLVSLVEWSIRQRGLLRRQKPLARVVLQPTFISRTEFDALFQEK